MKRATLTGLFCLGAIVVAAAAVDSVVLKRTPTKNQVIKYAMTGSIDFQGAPHAIAATETDTIQDVAADGSYTTKTEQADLTFDGMPAPVPGTATIAVNKPNGELVSYTGGDSPSPDQSRNAALTQFYYPTAPVNVGDSWSYEGKKDDKLGILGFKADMKLLGDEKIGTIDTWKVQEDVKETVAATPASLHTTAWISKADGSMVKADSTFTDMPFGGMPISGKISFALK